VKNNKGKANWTRDSERRFKAEWERREKKRAKAIPSEGRKPERKRPILEPEKESDDRRPPYDNADQIRELA
jgi:hypothetical protein